MADQKGISFKAILRARCPSCHLGRVTRGLFSIHPRCPHCGYDFHPEPGFYMGAIAVSFLLTAMVTIPPTIALKIAGVDLGFVLVFPLLEYVFVGPFLMYYCKILWLHLEYRMTDRLDGK